MKDYTDLLNIIKILDRLIPTTLGACWYWSEFYLYNYFVLQGVEQVFS